MQYSEVYSQCLKKNLIDQIDSSIVFVDIDRLKKHLKQLKDAFPKSVHHAIPIKTHPLLESLKIIGQEGFGLEAASYEELEMGRYAKVPTSKLVFDSPVKTRYEIGQCERLFPETILNANDISELEKYDPNTKLRCGLRVNPMMNTGAPDLYDVSKRGSKFGEPIDNEEEIIEAYVKYPFLTGIHVHAGSDIEKIENNAHIIERVFKLVKKIDKRLKKEGRPNGLSYIDIGGGASLPMDSVVEVSLKAYADEIANLCPGIFDDYQVITEFGRYTFAYCSWILSDINSIRYFEVDKSTLIIHVGADLFVREIYQSNAPKHSFHVLKLTNSSDAMRKYDIAGPLCFAGDYLARNINLPEINLGDKIIIENSGANSFALRSKHCSRSFPKVIHYSKKENKYYVSKKRENIEQVINAWK